MIGRGDPRAKVGGGKWKVSGSLWTAVRIVSGNATRLVETDLDSVRKPCKMWVVWNP